MKIKHISDTKIDLRITTRVFIDIIEYLLLLAVVCECQSMFTCKGEIRNDTNMTLFFSKMVIFLLVVAIFSHYCLYKEKYKNILSDLTVIMVIEVYSIIFYGLNVSGIEYYWMKQEYIKNFLIILPLFYLLFKMKKEEGNTFDLFYKHSDIVCTISYLGLIIYFSAILNNGMIPSDAIYTRWSALGEMEIRFNFYNMVILRNGGSWNIAGIALLRNYGFFTEPIMYSIPLIVALFTEMFLRSELDKKRLIRILFICIFIFTTTSTLALMIVAVAWALLFSRFCIKKHKAVLILPIIVAAILAVCFFYYEKQAGTYQNLVSGSIKEHAEDFIWGWRAFLSKPILGCGYGNEDYIRKFMSEERLINNRGFSNTVMVVLAEGGIAIAILCMTPFVILLLGINKANNRNAALWALGPLALYIGTIWHYHIFMMMIFAFGYSFVEINAEHKISLASVDTHQVYGDNNTGERLMPSFLIPLICLIIGIILMFAGYDFWYLVQHFLRSNGWDITLSAIKAFLFMTVVLCNCVIIRNALVEKKLGFNMCIAVILADVIYLCMYKFFYSVVNTSLWLEGAWTEENESLILVFLWPMIVVILFFIINKLRSLESYKDISIFLAKIAAVIVLLFLSVRLSLSDDVKLIKGHAEAVRVLTDASYGKVFVNDFSALHHIKNKKVSYIGTKDVGYSMYKDSSIVYWMGTNLKEMFDAGFMVTALSDDYVVYSNDEVAIQNLADQGYQWYRYYPYDQVVNLGDLAWKNGLSLTEAGSLLAEGQEKSISYGPGGFIERGQYNIRYSLHIDRTLFSDIDSNEMVALTKINYLNGQKNIAAREINLDDFDEEGNLELNIPFSIGAFTEGMEYLLLAKEWYPIEVKAIVINEKPDYITVTKRNGYYYPISEAYFNTDGTSYVDMYGVSRYDRDFDLIGRVKVQRYYDGAGNRVLNSNGISGIGYEYNRQHGVISETYFDEKDNVAANNLGYAIVRYVYDGYGNKIETRYFDANDKTINTLFGYATVKEAYDGNGRVIREEYYDCDDKSVCLEGGNAALERKYDENGNVLEENYFGKNGERILYYGSYSKILKNYDENRKVIKEEYFGVNDERLALQGGQATKEFQYDEAGNVTEERFFGTNNEPILYNGLFYRIEYKYDIANRKILEKYYGTDDAPIALPGDQGPIGYVEFTYDDNNVCKKIYYNLADEIVNEEIVE